MKTKFRKKRQMSNEQKAAAAERLRKAREAKGPAANLSVHESIRNLDDNHPLNIKKVREWLKTNKELRSVLKSSLRKTYDKSLNNQYINVDAYVTNMEAYLRTGVWHDLFYGERQQFKIKYRVVVPAYNADGTMKRTVGFWYDDVGEYTQEMMDEAHGRPSKKNDSQSTKTTTPAREKKQRRKRTLSEEQKAALVERLKKAREAKNKG